MIEICDLLGLERHHNHEARVIPVILRDADWQGAPFGKLQVLPRDGLPVKSWSNRDSAWKGVALGIRRTVEEVLESRAGGS